MELGFHEHEDECGGRAARGKVRKWRWGPPFYEPGFEKKRKNARRINNHWVEGGRFYF